MKTRKKVIKSPAKGRKSSILCLKKSPMVRRNLNRNIRNAHKHNRIITYESPLQHLHKNGPSNITSSRNLFKNEKVEINIDDIHKTKQKSCNNKNLPSASNNIIELIQDKGETDEKKDENKDQKHIDIISKQRDIFNVSVLDDMPYSKRIKINKSPLSRVNVVNKANKLSDSVILLDDTEFQPKMKTMLNNSKINTFYGEPKESRVNTELLTNSDEIVVIDSQNSSLIEVESYHNAFHQNVNLPTTSSKLRDSIIIIDPDDESPVQTTSTTPKFNEDCFVVWSSLPSACPSNTKPLRSNKTSLTHRNLKISESNKVIIDTQADLINLKHLNNENDKPSKNKFKKSPKIKKGIRKSFLKTPCVKTKFGTKSTTEVTVKSINKLVNKGRQRTSMKIDAKTNANSLKTKTKNNGELIFLSESKEDNETVTKIKKFKKGTLREIVIDGSNVAMAYTKNKTFSEKGIKMLIDYFTKKGHTVKVFVPQYRRSRNFQLLEKWHTEGIVIFTPSRKLGNKSFTPYDDRYILEYATACNGIVVSQDQFRDLYDEKPQYRDTIENRLLVPTFVGEYVMFPEDPLGREGPTLANFLKH